MQNNENVTYTVCVAYVELIMRLLDKTSSVFLYQQVIDFIEEQQQRVFYCLAINSPLYES